MLAIACADLGKPYSERLIESFAGPSDYRATQRYRRPHRRRQSLLARALLRRLLEEEAGLPRQLWTIDYGRGGKPAACGPDGQLTIEISVTHSRDRVGCAISAFGCIGMDIEYHSADRATHAIAEATFGPNERHTFKAAGLMGFYRLWSLREATAKALGVGLFDMQLQQDLFSSGPFDGVWRRQWGPQTWIFGHRNVPGDSSLAVALHLNTDVNGNEAWNCFRSRWQKVRAS